jgi:transcriptional regulator with XRE-family HTH domain
MNSNTFSAWRTEKGWSIRRTAKELGCSPKTVQSYESRDGPIPLYISLAIAALQYGLPPYP